MSDVFISYSRQNIEFAETLFDALSNRQISAWVDWKNIPRSAGWWGSIKHGIDEASTFIFIMSNDSLASAVCTLELAHAIRNGKRIIPVVIEAPDYEASFGRIAAIQADDVLRAMLEDHDLLNLARENRIVIGHINWIFFGQTPQGDEKSFDEALAELIETVQTDLQHNYKHARLLVRAREWEQGANADDLLLIGQEVNDAEMWLAEADARAKEPTPTALQRDYITMSRTVEDRRRRLLRNLRVGTLTFAAMGIVAVILAVSSLIASQQAQAQAADAEQREAVAVTAVAEANEQLTAVPPTLTEVGQQVADAEQREAAAVTAVSEGQATLDAVNTQVVIVEATVTQAAIVDDIVGSFANALLQQDENPFMRIIEANRIVERYPDQAIAWQTRGLAYAASGDYEQAITNYERAIELEPEDALTYFNRAGLYRGIGEFQLALDDYNRTIEADPTYAFAYNNRALVYLNLGEYELAIADYGRAIDLEPEESVFRNNRGLAYAEIGEYELAIADYDHAIELEPDYFFAHNNRGLTYHQLGEYELAIVDYSRAITINPNHVESYSNRGISHISLGEYSLALADFNRASEFDPERSNTYVLRGIVHTRMNNNDLALADFSRAIELNPQYAAAYYNRGDLYLDLGMIEPAFEDFERTIQFNPEHGPAYVRRGNIYTDLGDFDLAFADFARAIELDPEDGFAYSSRGIAGLIQFTETGSFDRQTVQADFEAAIALGLPVSDDLRNILNTFGIDLP